MRKSVFKRTRPENPPAIRPGYVDPRIMREMKMKDIREASKTKKLMSIGAEIEKYKEEKL
jgi:hypothetical protein